MRPPCFLSCIFVVLTAVPLADSLPTIDAVRSTSSSTTGTLRGDGRAPHHWEHLHKRRPEIHELEKRQQVNCTDPYAFFFSECWDILNVHDYLVNPETGWIATTRICQNSGGLNQDNNGANCCRDKEPWATCYLRLAIPGSDHDCTSTSVDRCDSAMLQDIKVDPSILPWVRYTVKNIYAINNFFVTYYLALQNAAGIVGNNIQKMIDVVDVVVEPAVPFQEILLSLAVGLAFLGAPSFATTLLGIKAIGLRASAQALVISSQQAPNIGRALWPTGTDQSRFIQTAELQLQLANISSSMSAMMDGGVRLLMTEPVSFVNYADYGRYSGPNVTDTAEGSPLTVPSAGDAVAYALKTYLVSYSMWQNKWYATFKLGPYLTATDVKRAFNCDIDPETGLCGQTGAIYWSPYTYRVYSLSCAGPDNALEPREMVKTILSYGWAPLSILFDGAFNCTSEGRAGSSAVNFNYDGTLDLSCVSQLPMYTSCGAMCPTTLGNGSCLFGNIGVVKPGYCDSYNSLGSWD
ncbi:MAG: hypothetical protein L6R36_002011 [Xanthoria steineri]|nr:MAG: hypothetical protein L6R36_002011 [Xanthoria steineri]